MQSRSRSGNGKTANVYIYIIYTAAVETCAYVEPELCEACTAIAQRGIVHRYIHEERRQAVDRGAVRTQQFGFKAHGTIDVKKWRHKPVALAKTVGHCPEDVAYFYGGDIK